ncbi:MAG: hypothetical protein H7Y43_09285, partial [Akkermansiaceae bacterium]|nr:hypothetical protein [Verrucomicrobiales bacterium]
FTLTLPSYITGTLVNNVGNNSVDLLVNTVTYPSITPSMSGSTLNLAWPAEFLGYRLQSQTNDLTVGITGTWFDEPNTGGATSINITVDPASPTVFYRLVYPYP